MSRVALGAALLASACAGREPDPVRVFEHRVAVYAEADSAALATLRARHSEDDYYAVADDMMWYRAESTDWLERHGIPVVFVEGRPRLSFVVGGEARPFAWPSDASLETVVLYEPGRAPSAVAPVDVALTAAAYFGLTDTTAADRD